MGAETQEFLCSNTSKGFSIFHITQSKASVFNKARQAPVVWPPFACVTWSPGSSLTGLWLFLLPARHMLGLPLAVPLPGLFIPHDHMAKSLLSYLFLFHYLLEWWNPFYHLI